MRKSERAHQVKKSKLSQQSAPVPETKRKVWLQFGLIPTTHNVHYLHYLNNRKMAGTC